MASLSLPPPLRLCPVKMAQTRTGQSQPAPRRGRGQETRQLGPLRPSASSPREPLWGPGRGIPLKGRGQGCPEGPRPLGGQAGGPPRPRLSGSGVPQTLCTKATMQTVRAADTNEVVKLIFRESDNDRKVPPWAPRPSPSGGWGDRAHSRRP